jgi:hypothetical protein
VSAHFHLMVLGSIGVDCLAVSGYIRKPSARPFNGLLRRFSGLLLPMVHAYALCDCRLFYAIQHKNHSLKTQQYCKKTHEN